MPRDVHADFGQRYKAMAPANASLPDGARRRLTAEYELRLRTGAVAEGSTGYGGAAAWKHVLADIISALPPPRMSEP